MYLVVPLSLSMIAWSLFALIFSKSSDRKYPGCLLSMSSPYWSKHLALAKLVIQNIELITKEPPKYGAKFFLFL